MRAALIPPIPHLHYAWDDPFHLVLSHLLGNPAYHAFYREQRLRGAFLVLDNGAHENTAGETMHDLLGKAKAIRADEIVLPDVLADHRATVKRTEDALTYLLGPGQDEWVGAYPRFMVVPQGATRDEWERCFHDLVAAYMSTTMARPDLFKGGLTIGVSKDYDAWEGGHRGLIEFLASFHEWVTFDVHLLGWARDLRVLRTLAYDFPWIRSTDSAKPFVYAVNGIALARHTSPAYPRRAPDYFEAPLGPEQLKIATHNVRVFREAAHDIR